MLKRICWTIFLVQCLGVSTFAQNISVKEVTQLETKLKQNPTDIETRLKLIAYYQVSKTLVGKKSLQTHRLGLIQNNPQVSNYTFFGLWTANDKTKSEYVELKNEWLKQLAKFPADSIVRLNTADFLTLAEPLIAEKVLKEGESLDPDFFFFPLRLMDLYNAQYDALESKAELDDEMPKDEDIKPSLEKTIAESKRGLAALEKADEATKIENERKFLIFQAIRSLELGDPKTAYDAAQRLHKNIAETKPQVYLYEYFRIVESVKGRAELMQGNLDGAKQYLFDSITATKDISNLTPIIDTRFIEELLIKEGTENVLKYLKLCENLNFEDADKKIVKKWENLLLKGRIPKFSDYRYTIENILIL